MSDDIIQEEDDISTEDVDFDESVEEEITTVEWDRDEFEE